VSRVLEEVMSYANEDVASIRKHWIIFVKMAKRILIFAIIMCIFNARTRGIVTDLAGSAMQQSYLSEEDQAQIRELENELHMSVTDAADKLINIVTIVEIGIVLIYALISFIKTFATYKSVGLQVNNIQIKGYSGVARIGQVNTSLEQIWFVRTNTSLLGSMLNYGSIEVNLNGVVFSMTHMTGVAEFQEAIILLQEAQKEGRIFRSDMRHEQTVQNQTYAQVQALGMLTQTVSQALPYANQNQAIGQTQVDMLPHQNPEFANGNPVMQQACAPVNPEFTQPQATAMNYTNP
jgi:hypothetical protein